jgi:radical SAM PhpK family P-methyltransferase
MMMLDCIIIGINEQSIDSYAKEQKIFKDHSGAYEEVMTNSVFMDGSYYTSIEMMNLLLNNNGDYKWNLNIFETPNLGVLYLANFLRCRNISIDFINHYNSGKEKLKELIEKGARCVAITTTFYVNDEPIIDIIRFVRSVDEKIKIIVGGPRVYEICTLYPDTKKNSFLKRIGADYFIVDPQGESALCDLLFVIKSVGEPDIQNIKNIVMIKDGELITSEREQEKNSLNENVIDWDMFKCHEFGKVVYMRTSRGCLYSCAFCTYPQLSGKYECTSLYLIEKEMNQLRDKGVRYIIFIDDSFNVPIERFKKICNMMVKNSYNFKWISFFRCIKVSESIVSLMKESGCIGVYLGVESLDKSILKKMQKLDVDYVACVDLFKKYNILTLGSFIIGFPGETEVTVKETISIFNKHPTDFYNVQLYYYSKLAPVYRHAVEYEIKGDGYAWSHYSMNWREAVYWKNYMIKNVSKSTLLPLYSSGIWALPYLMDQGISIDFFVEYAGFISDLIKENVNGNFETKIQILQRFNKMNNNLVNNLVERRFICQTGL